MLRNMTGVYILNGDKILLLYRVGSRVGDPSWRGIGGHFEKDELNDPEACALRELYEEAGITAGDITGLKLRYLSLRLKNNEIRQNYYFFANLVNLDVELKDCDEGALEWADINEALSRDMPLSAKYCLEHYFETGRYTDKIYAGATDERGVEWQELREF